MLQSDPSKVILLTHKSVFVEKEPIDGQKLPAAGETELRSSLLMRSFPWEDFITAKRQNRSRDTVL